MYVRLYTISAYLYGRSDDGMEEILKKLLFAKVLFGIKCKSIEMIGHFAACSKSCPRPDPMTTEARKPPVS